MWAEFDKKQQKRRSPPDKETAAAAVIYTIKDLKTQCLPRSVHMHECKCLFPPTAMLAVHAGLPSGTRRQERQGCGVS